MILLKYLKLNDFENMKLQYNWNTIYVGIYYNMFSLHIMTDYACELLVNNQNINDNDIIELAWEIEETKQERYLKLIKDEYLSSSFFHNLEWEKEFRKVRYVMLCKLKQTISNKTDLLKEIALFYDSIGYPEDMVSFINYMPQELGNSNVSPEDYLIENLNLFLKNEREDMYSNSK